MSLNSEEATHRVNSEQANARILETTLELKAEVGFIKGKIEHVCTNLEKLDEKVEKVHHVINGNGKPGIKERLAVMENRVLGISSEADAQGVKEFEKYMTIRRAVIGLLVAGAGFLASYLFDWIKGFF